MSLVPPGPTFPVSDLLLAQVIKSRALPMLQFLSYFPPFGDISHWHFYNRRLYFLNHPDLIREVMIDKAAQYRKNDFSQQALGPFLGKGLILSEGELHSRQRKLMQPAFHPRRVEGYAQLMVAHTEAVLSGWRVGEERDIDLEMMRLTLLIVGKTLLGVDLSASADRVGALVTAVVHQANETTRAMVQLPEWVVTPLRRKIGKTVAELHALVQKIIDERRGTDKGDLLSMLLLTRDESGAGMSDELVRDELVTMILAGHETTANLLGWALVLLAENPAVAAELQAEVKGVLGGRPPTLADLLQLPLVDQVIKETLRLYPSAPILSRQPVAPIELAGYMLPADAAVIVAPYFLHRDARYFVDPLRFWPQRWAGGLERSLPRGAYFPFGAGPRVCIGQQFAQMESKLLLASLVSHFRFALVPGHKVEAEAAVTLRPRYGLRMRLEAA